MRRHVTPPRLVVAALFLMGLVSAMAYQKWSGPGFGDEVQGVAVEVYDGDTFELERVVLAIGETPLWRSRIKIRIWGIEAAERGEHGFAEARDFLRDLVTPYHLTCRVIERQRAIGHYAARLVAQCHRATPGSPSDIAAEMVAAGYAVDSPEYSSGYYAVPE